MNNFYTVKYENVLKRSKKQEVTTQLLVVTATYGQKIKLCRSATRPNRGLMSVFEQVYYTQCSALWLRFLSDNGSCFGSAKKPASVRRTCRACYLKERRFARRRENLRDFVRERPCSDGARMLKLRHQRVALRATHELVESNEVGPDPLNVSHWKKCTHQPRSERSFAFQESIV